MPQMMPLMWSLLMVLLMLLLLISIIIIYFFYTPYINYKPYMLKKSPWIWKW